MSHELDVKNGQARFAYADRQDPWHRLGTPMRGLQTLDEMLAAAYADYTVTVNKVCVIGDDGEPMRNADGDLLIVEDSRATVRHDTDGSVDALTTVGTRFVATQNRDVIERALAVVGASGGDAQMDTIGVLYGGQAVFASISLDGLVIDPEGANDVIKRYLAVMNGHNGKVPVTYVNTDTRVVCHNTITAAIRGAQRRFTARHTRNMVDYSVEDAQKALSISTSWANQFKVMAEAMMAVPMPAGSARIDAVIEAAFPKDPTATDRQKANRDAVESQVRTLLAGPTNAAKVGWNGWAVYNAVGEYLDHFRSGTPDERALTSMDDMSWVAKTKLKAQAKVLEYA